MTRLREGIFKILPIEKVMKYGLFIWKKRVLLRLINQTFSHFFFVKTRVTVFKFAMSQIL